MQYNPKDYNPAMHDKFFALTVKQPYASKLALGQKKIEVRSKNTTYRGDLLICSSQKPIIDGCISGATLGLVELYDVKPISEFTEDDWDATRIDLETRAKIKGGWGWLVRNPRPVIEFPIKGQLGIYSLIYTKDTIIPYPTRIKLERTDY